jgi:16S rRNA (guanine(527)-N(7))-methyltransferase RsmG
MATKGNMGFTQTKLSAWADQTTANLYERYLDLLFEYNARFNLTAIPSREDAVVKHLLDSLAAEKHIPQNATLLDIGSGCGCPGIPLKIARPDISLTMLDSTEKKIGFLNLVIQELNLLQTTAICARAEEYAKTSARECFDVVTARAVAALPILLELCAPFVKSGGLLIAYKGVKEEESLGAHAAKTLGLSLYKKEEYMLDGQYSRTLLLYHKITHTPENYPRLYARIQKKPL